MIKYICLIALGGHVIGHPQDFLSAIGGLLGGAGGGRSLDSQQGLLNAASGLRNAILGNSALQTRILQNDLNPCNGAPPDYCSCTDGSRFSFSIEYNDNPCSRGGEPDLCHFPNGSTFKPENVVNNAVEKFGIPNCGTNQGRPREPDFCTCEDGSTFELVTVQIGQAGQGAQRCGGGLPRSCTCPGGQEITRNNFISRIIPALQDILSG